VPKPSSVFCPQAEAAVAGVTVASWPLSAVPTAATASAPAVVPAPVGQLPMHVALLAAPIAEAFRRFNSAVVERLSRYACFDLARVQKLVAFIDVMVAGNKDKKEMRSLLEKHFPQQAQVVPFVDWVEECKSEFLSGVLTGGPSLSGRCSSPSAAACKAAAANASSCCAAVASGRAAAAMFLPPAPPPAARRQLVPPPAPSASKAFTAAPSLVHQQAERMVLPPLPMPPALPLPMLSWDCYPKAWAAVAPVANASVPPPPRPPPPPPP